jgi:hypothetical protein
MSAKLDTTDEAPAASVFTPPVMTDDMKSEIANQVASALASALPAVLAELNKGTAPGDKPNQSMPTRASTVPLVSPATTPAKHFGKYRLDGVVSGKYQMVDPKAKGKYPDDPSKWVLKGKWLHVANEVAYAETEQMRDFIEFLIAEGVKFYLDEGTGLIPCPVSGCGKTFQTEEVLRRHLKATHGVE